MIQTKFSRSKLTLLQRLILITTMIGLVMLVVAGMALINNARQAIEQETDAGIKLARNYVIAAMGSLRSSNAPDDVPRFLANTLFQPRHVKIAIYDHRTGLTYIPGTAEVSDHAELSDEHDGAPNWFVDLLAPSKKAVHLPISVGMDTLGKIIVTTAPEHEIHEIWEDFFILAAIGLTSFLVALLALAICLHRALYPLTVMRQTFAALEDGDLQARVGEVPTPEFSSLGARFDRLADMVERTMQEKDALNRRLVELQDEEQRAIARELHDELGPCLFGMRVETRAIRDIAIRSQRSDLLSHADNLFEIVKQVQLTNRDILARLRPMEVGQLPLSQLLIDLVSRLNQLKPSLNCELDISTEFDGQLSEATQLHIFRILQEAMTNILRHAQAVKVSIELKSVKGPMALSLTIQDDGSGWSGTEGNGMRGMRERAQSLGGQLVVSSEQNKGMSITLRLPVEPVQVEPMQIDDPELTSCSA